MWSATGRAECSKRPGIVNMIKKLVRRKKPQVFRGHCQHLGGSSQYRFADVLPSEVADGVSEQLGATWSLFIAGILILLS